MKPFHSPTKWDLLFPLAGIVIVLIIVLFIVLFNAHQEAAAWNKFRDPRQPAATWWDALFLELRVEAKK